MTNKASTEMTERLRAMLSRDKMNVKEGFLTALNNDLNRLLGDYFELDGKCDAEVGQDDGGAYEITVKAKARRVKSFDSTADIKRR